MLLDKDTVDLLEVSKKYDNRIELLRTIKNALFWIAMLACLVSLGMEMAAAIAVLKVANLFLVGFLVVALVGMYHDLKSYLMVRKLVRRTTILKMVEGKPLLMESSYYTHKDFGSELMAISYGPYLVDPDSITVYLWEPFKVSPYRILPSFISMRLALHYLQKGWYEDDQLIAWARGAIGENENRANIS